MVGDIKGYCILKTLDNVIIGMNKHSNPKIYAEIQELLLKSPVRIIDIGAENSGFLVLEPQGRCICDVRSMDSVGNYFFCEQQMGILIPPGLSMLDKTLAINKRMMRKGGYNELIRKMVIINSLRKNEFNDNFLF